MFINLFADHRAISLFILYNIKLVNYLHKHNEIYFHNINKIMTKSALIVRLYKRITNICYSLRNLIKWHIYYYCYILIWVLNDVTIEYFYFKLTSWFVLIFYKFFSYFVLGVAILFIFWRYCYAKLSTRTKYVLHSCTRYFGIKTGDTVYSKKQNYYLHINNMEYFLYFMYYTA